MDQKAWSTLLTKAGVKPVNVSAWSGPFVALESSFPDRKELLEFLVQVLHETGRLSLTIESLNYSVTSLLQMFVPKRISEEQAKKYGRIDGVQPADQRSLANILYGGEFGRTKLGNTEANDGWNFRGSGLLQTTGRDNYSYIKSKTGLDVIANPDILRIPSENAVKCAVAQWRRLVKPSILNDEILLRKAINGGTLGLDDCRDLRSLLTPLI
jgi:putative chitinase